jgi:hypothetical protein
VLLPRLLQELKGHEREPEYVAIAEARIAAALR